MQGSLKRNWGETDGRYIFKTITYQSDGKLACRGADPGAALVSQNAEMDHMRFVGLGCGATCATDFLGE